MQTPLYVSDIGNLEKAISKTSKIYLSVQYFLCPANKINKGLKLALHHLSLTALPLLKMQYL